MHASFKNIIYLGIIIIILCASFFIGRCTAGASEDDYSRIKKYLDASLEEIRSLRTTLQESEQEHARLTGVESELNRVKQHYEQAAFELARIKQELENHQSTSFRITEELRESEYSTIRKFEELEKILFKK